MIYATQFDISGLSALSTSVKSRNFLRTGILLQAIQCVHPIHLSADVSPFQAEIKVVKRKSESFLVTVKNLFFHKSPEDHQY
jgi:hypothetical protein